LTQIWVETIQNFLVRIGWLAERINMIREF